MCYVRFYSKRFLAFNIINEQIASMPLMLRADDTKLSSSCQLTTAWPTINKPSKCSNCTSLPGTYIWETSVFEMGQYSNSNQTRANSVFVWSLPVSYIQVPTAVQRRRSSFWTLHCTKGFKISRPFMDSRHAVTHSSSWEQSPKVKHSCDSNQLRLPLWGSPNLC